MGKKMDSGRFASCTGDTQEQIRMCLNCRYVECINCLDDEHDTKDAEVDFDSVKELKRKRMFKNKKLSKDEKTLLSLYPTSQTDVGLSEITGFSTTKVFDIRKRLGLPVPKWIPIDTKIRLVEIWMGS